MNFSTVTSLSILLLMIGSFSTQSEAQYTGICNWLNNHFELICNGPGRNPIWVWRPTNVALECNDLCVKIHRRPGGKCVRRNNYDISTWCPPGQACRCFEPVV
jgi:hypothetical protein